MPENDLIGLGKIAKQSCLKHSYDFILSHIYSLLGTHAAHRQQLRLCFPLVASSPLKLPHSSLMPFRLSQSTWNCPSFHGSMCLSGVHFQPVHRKQQKDRVWKTYRGSAWTSKGCVMELSKTSVKCNRGLSQASARPWIQFQA